MEDNEAPCAVEALGGSLAPRHGLSTDIERSASRERDANHIMAHKRSTCGPPRRAVSRDAAPHQRPLEGGLQGMSGPEPQRGEGLLPTRLDDGGAGDVGEPAFGRLCVHDLVVDADRAGDRLGIPACCHHLSSPFPAGARCSSWRAGTRTTARRSGSSSRALSGSADAGSRSFPAGGRPVRRTCWTPGSGRTRNRRPSICEAVGDGRGPARFMPSCELFVVRSVPAGERHGRERKAAQCQEGLVRRAPRPTTWPRRRPGPASAPACGG